MNFKYPVDSSKPKNAFGLMEMIEGVAKVEFRRIPKNFIQKVIVVPEFVDKSYPLAKSVTFKLILVDGDVPGLFK